MILRLLADPLRGTVVIACALVAAGFVAAVLGWRGALDEDAVARQVPYLVSAGFGGVGLIAVGVAVAFVQHGRRVAADEADEIESMLSTLGESR